MNFPKHLICWVKKMKLTGTFTGVVSDTDVTEPATEVYIEKRVRIGRYSTLNCGRLVLRSVLIYHN